MRVLLCSYDSPATLHGGVEWYTVHLARALQDEGVDVGVVSRRPASMQDAPEGVQWTWAPLPVFPRMAHYRHRLFFSRRFARTVRRASKDVDIVHGQNRDAAGAAPGVLRVATVHTTPLDEWPSSRLGGWREVTYQGALHRREVKAWRRHMRSLVHAWCVSDVVADNVRSLGAGHVETVPNAVPDPTPINSKEARQRLGLGHGQYVLYLGRLSRVKGVHRLIDAVADTDLRLLVAGDGPERLHLERQARRTAPGQVRFFGRVDDATKAELYAVADAFCLPSDHEGQPLTILEAMRSGLPVVATDASWVPKTLRPFGHWGTDLPRLLRDALDADRPGPAPVPSYRDLARRFISVYDGLVTD